MLYSGESDDDIENFYDDLDELQLDQTPCNESTAKLYLKYCEKIDLSVKNSYLLKDKSNRATTDHALDARSKTIIFKLMNQKVFDEINGCISTGKEANVYHAISEKDGDFALKVYMTSIMPFKSRDKYLVGDFRMRKNYTKSSSFKYVSKWAEKEFRNLKRIIQSGLIKCPEPIKLKGVVLLMSFVGKNGIPAPKLKDALACDWSEVPDEIHPDWPKLYTQVALYMRTLYQKCRLVHGDLSEYNLLYLDGFVWIIDVSQSVEHESPKALEYLRTDCHNINAFFRRTGINTLTLRELFEWIVDPTVFEPGTKECSRHWDEIFTRAQNRGHSATLEDEDEAFRLVNIPRNLTAVTRFARDFIDLSKGKLKEDDIYYAVVAGVKPDFKGIKEAPHLPEMEESDDDPDSKESDDDPDSKESDDDPDSKESDDDSDSKEIQDSSFKLNPAIINGPRPKNETLSEKKERKKAVREAKAEKRRIKMPKSIKKRAVKAKS